MRPRFTIPIALVLAGCGASGGGGFQQEFVEACTSSSNLDRAVCGCMAEKAEADLSDDERSFLLAVLRKDEARIQELRTRLSLAGAARAGTFMTEVASCAIAPPE